MPFMINDINEIEINFIFIRGVKKYIYTKFSIDIIGTASMVVVYIKYTFPCIFLCWVLRNNVIKKSCKLVKCECDYKYLYVFVFAH